MQKKRMVWYCMEIYSEPYTSKMNLNTKIFTNTTYNTSFHTKNYNITKK